MGDDLFRYEKGDGIAHIFFNRPDRLNAINDRVLDELEEILQNLTKDMVTRVVILSGMGRAFSAGADLEMLSSLGQKEGKGELLWREKRRFGKKGSRVTKELENLEQITIAAINGYAIGGGFALALACDFRIAAEDASMWIPEVDLGVPMTWGTIPRMVGLMGPSRAMEFTLTCDRLSAKEALEWGLVNKVVPAGEALKISQEFAEKILKKPPIAVHLTKSTVRAISSFGLGDVTFCDPDFFQTCAESQDMEEAVRAFREKREPRFQGK
ncbi:MAG: enoyl-CoA hydratase/isomerase family protein [Candidatus Tectomicrobia bacterium]|uniref:Enoyl-CoA hydratase/isomerase family protein n=1 Tax=Tectimicrobiota bacterium TaxID=2528274 RepID=A0A932CQV6_UNCTE|nr:enoyl-CoA hydratase/isomerase family protein [Candidatus Tectomicrobia bacterium]